MTPSHLLLLALVAIALVHVNGENEWKIVFLTGNARYAGTDDPIYFKVNGDKGSSSVEYVGSEKSSFEANSFYLKI